MKLLKQDILKRVKKIAHFDDISKMLLQLGHENNLEDSLVDLELTLIEVIVFITWHTQRFTFFDRNKFRVSNL